MPSTKVFTLEYFMEEIETDNKAYINIIQENHAEAYSKYLSAIAELVAVCKKGVGLYIEYTKEAIDARKWALEIEDRIQHVINRIDYAK